MRVALIYHGTKLHGSNKQGFINLAKSLENASIVRGVEPDGTYAEQSGLNEVRIPHKSIQLSCKGFLTYPTFLLDTSIISWKFLKHLNGFDILQTFSPISTIILSKSGIPVVYYPTMGDVMTQPKNLWKKLVHTFIAYLERKAVEKASKVIVNCKRMKETFLRQTKEPESKFVIAVWGTEPQFSKFEQSLSVKKEYGIENCFSILFIGRVEYMKGVDVLVKAVEKVSKIVKIKLLIVGELQVLDPKYVPRLRTYVKSHNLENIVKLIGTLSHEKIGELLANVNLFVLPSRTEGRPLVLQEAVAVNCPVIASRVGGVLETVPYKNTFTAENHEELAEKILQVVDNSKEFIVQPKEYVWSETGQKFREVYNEIVN